MLAAKRFHPFLNIEIQAVAETSVAERISFGFNRVSRLDFRERSPVVERLALTTGLSVPISRLWRDGPEIQTIKRIEEKTKCERGNAGFRFEEIKIELARKGFLN